MDQLEAFNKFANVVKETLNAAGVKPVVGDKLFTAAMVVVAHTENEEQPIAGSLNWDPDMGQWRIDPIIQQGKPVA